MNELLAEANKRANEKLIKIAESFSTPDAVNNFIDRTSNLSGMSSKDITLSPPDEIFRNNAAVFESSSLETAKPESETKKFLTPHLALGAEKELRDRAPISHILNAPRDSLRAFNEVYTKSQDRGDDTGISASLNRANEYLRDLQKFQGQRIEWEKDDQSKGHISPTDLWDEKEDEYRRKAEAEVEGGRDEARSLLDDFTTAYSKNLPDSTVKYDPRFSDPYTLFHELSHASRVRAGSEVSKEEWDKSHQPGTSKERLLEETLANWDALKNTARYSPMEYLNPRTTNSFLTSQGSYINDFVRGPRSMSDWLAGK